MARPKKRPEGVAIPAGVIALMAFGAYLAIDVFAYSPPEVLAVLTLALVLFGIVYFGYLEARDS